MHVISLFLFCLAEIEKMEETINIDENSLQAKLIIQLVVIIHSSMQKALVKKNVPKVWSTPSFKALKNVNFFDFK